MCFYGIIVGVELWSDCLGEVPRRLSYSYPTPTAYQWYHVNYQYLCLSPSLPLSLLLSHPPSLCVLPPSLSPNSSPFQYPAPPPLNLSTHVNFLWTCTLSVFSTVEIRLRYASVWCNLLVQVRGVYQWCLHTSSVRLCLIVGKIIVCLCINCTGLGSERLDLCTLCHTSWKSGELDPPYCTSVKEGVAH